MQHVHRVYTYFHWIVVIVSCNVLGTTRQAYYNVKKLKILDMLLLG